MLHRHIYSRGLILKALVRARYDGPIEVYLTADQLWLCVHVQSGSLVTLVNSICCCLIAKSLTLCDPVDCSLPSFSVHGISQARILERVSISFSRGSSLPRDQTHISCIGRPILYHLSHLGSPPLCFCSHSPHHEDPIFVTSSNPSDFPGALAPNTITVGLGR